MKKTILLTILIGAAALALVSCSIDQSPVEPPAEDTFTAQLRIHAPTFARTDSTNSLWLEEIEITVPLPEETANGEGGDHHGKILGDQAASVDTTINGITIEFELEDGIPMLHHKMGQWVVMNPGASAKHLEISLEDAREEDAHDDTLYARIFNCIVELTVEKDGVQEEHHLDPVFGQHGFYYGENFALPDSGGYTLTLSVSAPTFVRDEHTSEKWLTTVVDTSNYLFDGTPLTDEVEVASVQTSDSLSIEIEAKAAKSLWHLEADGTLEEHTPDTTATHHFMVTVEDLLTIVHSRKIGYAEVHVTVTSHLTASSAMVQCHPMFGEDGFHYGQNIELPGGSTGDEPGNGDGDGHDGH